MNNTAARLRALQETLYRSSDPSASRGLIRALADALDASAVPSAPVDRPAGDSNPFLGRTTTGLSAETQVCMDAIPTSIYHLFNPATDPLVTVRVRSHDLSHSRRVRVQAYIERLSARAVRTVELEPEGHAMVPLLPTLFQDRAREVTEVQWVTVHVEVADLDGKEERHDTYPILCLARSTGFNFGTLGTATQPARDLSHYYGAWVTPHVDAVEQQIRRAADLIERRQIWGYQEPAGVPLPVEPQVRALFQSLVDAEIRYINSPIAYGLSSDVHGQRVRLPRESLATKSANCIDGTVLMASLLEGAALEPAIVLVPGHAFVGWKLWPDREDWEYLETTLIGEGNFDRARASGNEQYAEWSARKRARRHALSDLRARRIWPME